MTVNVITLRLLLSGLILHAFCREGVDSGYTMTCAGCPALSGLRQLSTG
jgi:hypothetical protein